MTDSVRQEPGPRNPRLNSVNLTSVCIKLKTKCTNYEEKKREVEIQFTPPSLFTACLRLENQDLTSQPLSRPCCPPGRVYCPALLKGTTREASVFLCGGVGGVPAPWPQFQDGCRASVWMLRPRGDPCLLSPAPRVVGLGREAAPSRTALQVWLESELSTILLALNSLH